jgi:hypothetical protein
VIIKREAYGKRGRESDGGNGARSNLGTGNGGGGEGNGVTHQLPPLPRDLLHTRDGLHKHVVRHPRLRNPYGAQEVDPVAVDGLLERAALVGAEDARDGIFGRDGALAAEPLAFGDVGDAVAVCIRWCQ